jgi:anti-sigma B factor antagonist
VADKTATAGSSRGRTAIPGAIEFAVSVTASDEVTLVEVRGELDCYTAPQLQAVLDELADGPPRRVVLDIGRSPFIDSTGLGVLVGALRRLRQGGGEMVVRSPSPTTARLFEITGVNTLFEIA